MSESVKYPSFLLRLTLIAVIFLWILPCRATNQLLGELDGIIDNRTDFNQERRTAIDQGWEDYHGTDNPADRYNILRGLYENYRSYRIDSALIVADMRLSLARELGDHSKAASASLNLAEGYVRSGAPDKAIAILDTIAPNSLRDYHYKYRNSIYRTAYELKAETALLPRDRVEAIEMVKKYRDDASANSGISTRGTYIHEAEKLRDAGLMNEAVAKMEEAARQFDFSSDAAMLYTMGELYLSAGRTDDAVDCLTRSAIIDLKSGTKEYRSLILLASILFEKGDIERSFNYINCAFDDANFSKANLRTAEIMKSMPVIYHSFHDAEREMTARIHFFLVLTIVFSTLLLLALIYAIILYKTRKRMMAEIKEINTRLESQNRKLAEADSLKLKHINELMLAYAGYISRLKDFRKTIMRQLKASQFEIAYETVKSDKAEINDIAVFHEMFDSSFLSMFPDFLNDINKVMKTPVELKANDRLTPELRIAAMMKVGITSTENIAKMLHYSPQTVYNLRSTLRTMINIGWEEFETYLTTI